MIVFCYLHTCCCCVLASKAGKDLHFSCFSQYPTIINMSKQTHCNFVGNTLFYPSFTKDRHNHHLICMLQMNEEVFTGECFLITRAHVVSWSYFLSQEAQYLLLMFMVMESFFFCNSMFMFCISLNNSMIYSRFQDCQQVRAILVIKN